MQPFDIKSVPLAAVPVPEEREAKQKSEGMLISQGPVRPMPVSREENFTEKLAAIPEFRNWDHYSVVRKQ